MTDRGNLASVPIYYPRPLDTTDDVDAVLAELADDHPVPIDLDPETLGEIRDRLLDVRLDLRMTDRGKR